MCIIFGNHSEDENIEVKEKKVVYWVISVNKSVIRCWFTAIEKY